MTSAGRGSVEHPDAPSRVLLIGMMGVGKSTVGRVLAARLGWPFLDSDAETVRRAGRTVRDIFETDGEAAFRAEEKRTLAAAATGRGPCVIGVAGGAVIDPDSRRLVRGAGLVVWLRAAVPTLVAQVGRGNHRPLLGDDPAAALARLYPERRTIYEELAEIVIDVDDLRPDEVCDRIQHRLTERAQCR